MIAGCSDSAKTVNVRLKYITTSSAPINAYDRNAQVEVAQAASSAANSLQEVSAIDQARAPKVKVQKPWNASTIGMTQRASIDWNGPVQPIVQKIADATGYRLRVIGAKPPIPALVLVNAENQPLADILRNVMYQVHNKADIKVYPKTHILELRYFPS